MKTFYIDQSDTSLLRQVERAADRTRHSRPDELVAVVVRDEHTLFPVRRGLLAGKISIPDDFDTMCRDEIEQMFGINE